MPDEPRWAAVILAAGYGSRLQKDIEADPSKQFDHLLGQPKGLLPVGGVPLLDHWLRSFRDAGNMVGPVIIVTNEFFHRQFTEWAVSRGLGRNVVVNDGTTSNDNRLGACRDLHLALEAKADIIGDRDVLVVAGDTLFFQDFSLRAFLQALPPDRSGVVTYEIQDAAETRKRGIVEKDHSGKVTRLLEKPDPSETKSRSACPAFYAYRHPCKPLLTQFLAEKASEPLDAIDAPGRLLAYLIDKVPVQAVPVSGRFDIGNLGQYRDTLAFYQQTLNADLNAISGKEVIVARAYARAALIGNPSDGFGGKTLSLLCRNFHAEVKMRPTERLVFVPHPEYDRDTEFANMGELLLSTELNGYYGGMRLLRAATKRFAALCEAARVPLERNFTMSYDTNIPRMVGLSGSSAIITAAFRALLHFYSDPAAGGPPALMRKLGMEDHDMPQHILDVESQELGIVAGLQDRVIQWYGGCVHMDFGEGVPRATAYSPVPCELLPPLYLAFNTRLLGDSGKVHSPVRARFAAGDPVVVEGMRRLAVMTDLALEALKAADYVTLCDLMDENFALRRSMYGDAAVGDRNIELVETARAAGLAAKFTGSGGACICLKRPAAGSGAVPDPSRVAVSHPLLLSEEEEATLRDTFEEKGFTFVHVRFDDDGSGGGRSPLSPMNASASGVELRGAVLQID
mmetsp:Transcript_24984/g.73382  ORF Transcript_24984/g.73382 Transcript_24984/m.73382 type:complete len:682 (+) Transcript_24984:72-2117(+)